MEKDYCLVPSINFVSFNVGQSGWVGFNCLSQKKDLKPLSGFLNG